MREMLKDLLKDLSWYDKIIIPISIIAFLVMWITILVFWWNHDTYTKMMIFKEFWIWYIIVIPAIFYSRYKIS